MKNADARIEGLEEALRDLAYAADGVVIFAGPPLHQDAKEFRQYAEKLHPAIRRAEELLTDAGAGGGATATKPKLTPDQRVALLAVKSILDRNPPPPHAEPVAFQVQLCKGCTLTYQDKQAAHDKANAEGGGTVVPLYRAPPPPRGWLTAKEREAVRRAASVMSEEYHHGPTDNEAASVLRALLSRNSPPRVRLPQCQYEHYEDGWTPWFNAIKAMQKALAAAGVEVNE